MCDFFFIQPPRRTKYSMNFNVAFSRDENPDDESSDAVIKILWFHM